MLSRIFWIGLAGIAMIAGMILQDGNRIFHWADHHDMSAQTERAIEARVERAVEGKADKMQIVGSDGREVDVPPEVRRALADAVGELVKAETDLAILRVRDGSAEERQAAETRRAEARAEVERLKAVIKVEEQTARAEHVAVREQIRREIRDDIRATVRDAVGN